MCCFPLRSYIRQAFLAIAVGTHTKASKQNAKTCCNAFAACTQRVQTLLQHLKSCQKVGRTPLEGVFSSKGHKSSSKTAQKPMQRSQCFSNGYDMPADVASRPTSLLCGYSHMPACRSGEAGRAIHFVCCNAVPAAVSAAGSLTTSSAHPAHVRDGQRAHSSLLQ